MLRLILILPTIISFTTVFAKTIVVGKNQSVTTIRKAVELAKDKDTILVLPGIYKEGNITITKSITLIGQSNRFWREKKNMKYLPLVVQLFQSWVSSFKIADHQP